jgi:RNA polymerase sigma-70 factor (ECF subfamily)
LAAVEPDEELVRRVQKGDRRAFDLLFLRYRHKIKGLVGRFVRDPAELDDVVQEAFIKAYRALPNFRGESAFYTWLYRIAVNASKNYVAASSRRTPTVDIDVGVAEQLEQTDGTYALRDGDSPEQALRRDELAATIRQAIMDLPDDLRTTVTLREFDGLSYRQIAEITDCPVGTVRSRIFRAREALDERIRYLVGPRRRQDGAASRS